MTDDHIDNRMIYALLQNVRDEQIKIRQDISEIKDRLTLMDSTIAGLRADMANLYGLYAHQSGRIDRIEQRLERIEHRLELSEEPARD